MKKRMVHVSLLIVVAVLSISEGRSVFAEPVFAVREGGNPPPISLRRSK